MCIRDRSDEIIDPQRHPTTTNAQSDPGRKHASREGDKTDCPEKARARENALHQIPIDTKAGSLEHVAPNHLGSWRTRHRATRLRSDLLGPETAERTCSS